MDVYLLDGTYELFRHQFAMPSQRDPEGREVAATVGVVATVLGMFEAGVTHLGVATDHVIESFRNELWPAYKSSAGVDPVLLQQFPLLEEALHALGVVVWPMIRLEADDALGAAARLAAADAGVGHVFICTPDKDLAQCVQGERVVQLDRRTRQIRDEAGVVARFGVPPASIPDYLALVGDSADGYPGLPGWGAKSAATVLARYGHLTEIPTDVASWGLPIRGAAKLVATLRQDFELALLFRDLATLRTDAQLFQTPAELRWAGPTEEFRVVCERLGTPHLLARAQRLAPTA